VKVAVLGAGRIGTMHAGLLATQPEVSQLVVHDVDAARATALANALGAGLAASAEAAIAEADAVVIAASTIAHAELVRLAIEAGKPAFVEKPLAFDLADTVTLVERAEAAGAVVQVGFQRRFDPAYVEARRLLHAGELGRLSLVRLIAHDHTPPPDAYIPTSGGLFRDSSIHDFDAIRWLTGQEVVEVYAAGSVRNFPIFAEYDDVDTAAVILTLADGTIGVLSQTRQDPRGYDVRMELVGSKDVVAVGLDERTPLRSLEPGAPPSGQGWDSFLDRFEAAYRAELLAFLRVARGELQSPCTARDGLEAMRISIAATVSRAEHRPVLLTEI
jgi:myo-inositol 2-dehydrogenase / D-chiro-inositol 1-dehydrogenase